MKNYLPANQKVVINVSLIIIGCLSLISYYPGLNGPFVFDDGPNIVENPPLRITSLGRQEVTDAITAIKAGPLGRPVSYLTFALNYYLFGDHAFSFKLTNVLIHFLNGFSIFILTGLLLRSFRFAHRLDITKRQIKWTALLVSSLWLLHPIGLTSVLYVVQRMTSLASLFTFLSLSFYVSGRLRQIVHRNAYVQFILSFFVFFPLAVLSKENAALIPIFILLIELSTFANSKKHRILNRLNASLILIGSIPIVGIILNLDGLIVWLNHTYELRPFTLSERILTETRVIWFYIKLIILPRLSEFGLYHDDILVSKGLFTPFSTLLSLMGLFGLLASAVLLRKKAPVFSFGILFFLIGHSIESSFFPLEIAHEHRNYLPMFGVLIIMGYYSVNPTIIKRYANTTTTGLIILISMCFLITIQRASQWSDHATLAFSLAQNHPKSARSNYEAGRILINLIEINPKNQQKIMKYYAPAHKYFTSTYQTDKSNSSGLFAILYLDSISGKSIDSGILHELKSRLIRNPVSPSTSNSFSDIQKCWIQDRCTLDPNILVDLYQTALKNPLMTPKSRSSLYNELAILKFKLGHGDAALGLFKKAVGTRPDNPQLWFNYIQTLIDLGKRSLAKEQLGIAEKRFHIENDRETIDRLAKQLRQRNKDTTKL